MIIVAHFIDNGSGTDPGWTCLLNFSQKQLDFMQKFKRPKTPYTSEFRFKIPKSAISTLERCLVEPPQQVQQLWTVYLENF